MALWHIYHENIPAFLAEAARTPAMQRLKGVGMNCGCEYTAFDRFRGWKPYSRFDHSVGAALITWHFTGSKTQAMAALLHDIATPVFSHVVDFLRGDHEHQESTESGTQEMILCSSELTTICRSYGIDPVDVTDYHRYPIADNDTPRLSADRLEYTLGNIVNFGFGTEETVRSYYEDLIATEDELVFRTPQKAVAFAADAMVCGKIYVCDEDRFSMQTLADLLKTAVKTTVLTEADFYRQEKDVIAKIQSSQLLPRWQDFCQLHRLIRHEDGRVIPAKKRYIDPATAAGIRASGLSAAFAAELTEFLTYSFDYGLCAVK